LTAGTITPKEAIISKCGGKKKTKFKKNL